MIKLEEIKNKIQNIDWATRRKYYYFIFFIFIFLVILFYISYPILFPAPTCFDKKQNGSETGADCGGSCSLMCKNTYSPLQIVLQRSFASVGSTSDIMIVFRNVNKNIAPYKIDFDVDLYNKAGDFLETLKIDRVAGTQEYIPILIDNYKNENVGKVFVKNINYDMYRTVGAYTVALKDYEFSQDKTLLTIKLRNIYKEDLKSGLVAYVLVRDELDNIIGVNKQNLNSLPYDGEETLNFLWDKPIEGNVKNIDVFVVSNLYY